MTVNDLEQPELPVERSMKRTAHDKKAGMSLAELGSFVQEALRQNVPGTVVPKPHMGWRGQIEGLSVTWGSEP